MIKLVILFALACLVWTIAPAMVGRLARWVVDKMSGRQRQTGRP